MTILVNPREYERVTYVLEIPLNGGDRLLVQASEDDLPPDLELAALSPSAVVSRAKESLEQSLDHVRPAIATVAEKLRALSPDELTVEFGIVFTAGTGAVIARAGADVHFGVTLTWTHSNGSDGNVTPKSGIK